MGAEQSSTTRVSSWLPDYPTTSDHTERTKFYNASGNIDLRSIHEFPPIIDIGSSPHAVVDMVLAATAVCHSSKVTKKEHLSNILTVYNNQSRGDSGRFIRDVLSSACDLVPIIYYNIDRQSILNVLHVGRPVIFGISVPEEYRAFFQCNGVFLHCGLIVGFEDDSYIIRNCWGKSFQQDGYYNLPKEMVESLNITGSFWVVEPMYSNMECSGDTATEDTSGCKIDEDDDEGGDEGGDEEGV